MTVVQKNNLTVQVHNGTEFNVDVTAVVEVVEWFADQETFPFEELSIAVVGDDEMARLNEDFHGESGTTDVLSFDYDDGGGEIILDPYQHRRQAGEFDNDTNEEFLENIIHGLLHLAGFDHTRDEGRHLERQRELVENYVSRHPEVMFLDESVA